MSITVNIAEAKAKLSALADRAAAGEEIVLAKAGRPLARIVPLAEREPRRPGAWRHLLEEDGPPLEAFATDDEDLDWAEGRYDDEADTSSAKPGRGR